MSNAMNADAKRARPQLNVYTGLLFVALLLAIGGGTLIAMSNMEVSDKSGLESMFETASPAR